MQSGGQAVLIMAGGTGGHIFPGLAVADVLRQNGVRVHWLGARGAMECQSVPPTGIELDTVDIGGLRGKGLAGWLTVPLRLGRAVFQAFRIIGRVKPACAVSFGGYAAGPGGLAARLRGIPLLVHEQNRIAGLTNRVLARLASTVMQAFPGTWNDRLKPVTCGNPVRSAVASLQPPEQRFAERHGPVRVLITGGSQGAAVLNRILPEAIQMIPVENRPRVRHQAGRGAAESTLSLYRNSGIDAQVSEFIDDMAAAYTWADLVVCRAGALTISELAAAGLGAILIPFPYAVDDHQSRNAEYLFEVGAALIIQESTLSADLLAQTLTSLFEDRASLQKMAQAARSVSVPDAASRVADICIRAAGLEIAPAGTA
jgi:UDP-N-acetylglucosamine--N-acetylmuramyl-(pentapeptide) pyrophosphoryl-undecaprenol N-acetylglucosamine transferase